MMGDLKIGHVSVREPHGFHVDRDHTSGINGLSLRIASVAMVHGSLNGGAAATGLV